jgi:hypothetical protein
MVHELVSLEYQSSTSCSSVESRRPFHISKRSGLLHYFLQVPPGTARTE